MRFTSGKVRLSAEFSGGHLIRPMRVASFRVPSGAIDGIRYEPPQIDGVQAVLEEVARQLGPNVDKITAEYSLDQRGADLQWLDVEWAV